MCKLPKVVLRLTTKDDPYIPRYCEVYLVKYGDSYHLYITSSIHETRLRKSCTSYSCDYFNTHSLIQDTHYMALVSRFK